MKKSQVKRVPKSSNLFSILVWDHFILPDVNALTFEAVFSVIDTTTKYENHDEEKEADHEKLAERWRQRIPQNLKAPGVSGQLQNTEDPDDSEDRHGAPSFPGLRLGQSECDIVWKDG